jgi:hypothetical protein
MPFTKYGRTFPDGLTDLEANLYCLASRRPQELGGLSSYQHLRNIIEITWPKTQWNPWLINSLRSMINYRFVGMAGCATSGKTFSASLFAMSYWLAQPDKTSVILTSTTAKSIRKRMWPVIQELYFSAATVPESPVLRKGFPGNMVDSRTTLQATKGDDKHGIFAIAVREGPTSKATADIQGIHSPRMLIVIDEATECPEAILEVVSNLKKGTEEFTIICIGNPESRHDPHGRLCEPVNGWNSVSVNDEEWETPPRLKYEIPPGIVLHFDGEKSPNLRTASDNWPFLYTRTDLANARANSEFDETLTYWKYTRGFWPPEGIKSTLFTDALIEKHQARGKFTFLSQRTKLAFMDAGYGGDACILRIGEVGDVGPKKLGINLTKKFRLRIRVNDKKPAEDQIFEQVKERLRIEGIEPENFGYDATGRGAALRSVFHREWQNRPVPVEFGGAPSDLPASSEDRRPAKEVYDRRVTELWYSARNFTVNGQLRGLDTDECVQFCSREIKPEKERKKVLDTKDECKAKIGRSPDDADSVVGLVEMARRLGAVAGVDVPTRQKDGFRKMVERCNASFEPSYAEEEIAA